MARRQGLSLCPNGGATLAATSQLPGTARELQTHTGRDAESATAQPCPTNTGCPGPLARPPLPSRSSSWSHGPGAGAGPKLGCAATDTCREPLRASSCSDTRPEATGPAAWPGSAGTQTLTPPPEESWARRIRHHKGEISLQILHLNQQHTGWSVQASLGSNCTKQSKGQSPSSYNYPGRVSGEMHPGQKQRQVPTRGYEFHP